MLYSTSSSLIHFIHSNCNLSNTYPYIAPPYFSLLTGSQYFVLYICEYVHFVVFICLFFQIPYVWGDRVFIFLWIILLSIIVFRSIQFVADCRIPFFLMTVKVLVAQSCPTICDPIDCSLSGSSVHGILQAMGSHSFFQGIFPSQRSDLCFLHCRQILTVWATRKPLLMAK